MYVCGAPCPSNWFLSVIEGVSFVLVSLTRSSTVLRCVACVLLTGRKRGRATAGGDEATVPAQGAPVGKGCGERACMAAAVYGAAQTKMHTKDSYQPVGEGKW